MIKHLARIATLAAALNPLGMAVAQTPSPPQWHIHAVVWLGEELKGEASWTLVHFADKDACEAFYKADPMPPALLRDLNIFAGMMEQHFGPEALVQIDCKRDGEPLEPPGQRA